MIFQVAGAGSRSISGLTAAKASFLVSKQPTLQSTFPLWLKRINLNLICFTLDLRESVEDIERLGRWSGL